MKVREISYDLEQLEQYRPNQFFQKFRDSMIVDFEVVMSNFLEIDLPDTISDAQKAQVKQQKTDFLSTFISGHLNLLDPTSKTFKGFNEVVGGEETQSGLILPPEKKIITV